MVDINSLCDEAGKTAQSIHKIVEGVNRDHSQPDVNDLMGKVKVGLAKLVFGEREEN